MTALSAVVLCLLAQTSVEEEMTPETPRDMVVEIKMGPYWPMIDREPTLTNKPNQDTFGAAPMLLAELEVDRQFFQKFGSLGAGFSIGYAEKYGHATDPATGLVSTEATALQIVPMQLLAVYRFDYMAIHWSVPIVPYVKGGLVMTPWWASKGGEVETSNGLYGAGVRWGVAGIFGAALQLDFLEPRLARDLDSTSGINHSYLFAEFHLQEVNDFGQKVLDLSSRHWMFGLALEF